MIYTDGSCSPNPGKGGWAVILKNEHNLLFIVSGNDSYTTNNKMEMKAFFEALKIINEIKIFQCQIITDSKYVMNQIGQIIENGKITGYLLNQLHTNKQIKNKQEWLEIKSFIESNNLSFTITWTKGHSNCKYNNMVDKLANNARLKLI